MWAILSLKIRDGSVRGISSAQGIAAEIPQQTAKRFARNWSGKPGFCAPGAQKCAHNLIKINKRRRLISVSGCLFIRGEF
jgi:hypothetical protein